MRECWNGRQARLRCVWSTPCGFESHLSHQESRYPFGYLLFCYFDGTRKAVRKYAGGIFFRPWESPFRYHNDKIAKMLVIHRIPFLQKQQPFLQSFHYFASFGSKLHYFDTFCNSFSSKIFCFLLFLILHYSTVSRFF